MKSFKNIIHTVSLSFRVNVKVFYYKVTRPSFVEKSGFSFIINVLVIASVLLGSACQTAKKIPLKTEPDYFIGHYKTFEATNDELEASVSKKISPKSKTDSKIISSYKQKQITSEVLSLLMEARGYIGTPYLYGGNTKRGIDGTALISKVYEPFGLMLPKSAAQQATVGIEVKFEEIEAGDLIFFHDSSLTIGHVGIVTQIDGNDIQFIHASSSQGVKEDWLTESNWRAKFTRAVRVL